MQTFRLPSSFLATLILSADALAPAAFATPPAPGSLDTAFNPGSITDADITAIAVQAGGKPIVGGDFTAINGTARNHVARLNTDGTVDTTFDPTSFGADGLPTGLTLDPATGVISGLPTAPGTFSIALSATNDGGTGVSTLTLTVFAPTVNLAVGGGGAAVEGGANGVVIVTRTGDTTLPLTVAYKGRGQPRRAWTTSR